MNDLKTVHWFEPDEEEIRGWREWLAERPAAVRAVAERFPPWTLWRLDLVDEQGEPDGRFQRVYPMSFLEQINGTVLLRVAVDGQFNLVAFERQVFGIDPEKLKPTTLPGPDEPVGSADLPIELVKAMMGKEP